MSTALVSSTFFGDFGDHYRSNGSTALQNSSKEGFATHLDKKSTLAQVYNSVHNNNNNNNSINNLNQNNINVSTVMSRRLVTTTSSVPLSISHSSHRLQTSVPVMHQKSPIGVHNTTTQPSLSLVRGLSTTSPSQQCSQNNTINGNNNKEHKKLDRSYSEPAEKSAQQLVRLNSASAAVAGPMSSRYKTELCRSFGEVGTCKYGDKCQFAHGGHELRVITRHPKFKTENCKSFHSTGFCPYGPRCHFIHNSEESKKNMLNNLSTNGSNNGCPNGVNTSGGHNQIINGNTSGFRQTYHSNANTHPLRPKALSIGSYSLGSSGEVSPPSSQSGSPTSLNSFFTEDPFNPFVSPTNPGLGTCANNAFSFSPDFASLVPTNNKSSPFGGSQPTLCHPFPLTANINQEMSEQSVVGQSLTSPNGQAFEHHMSEGSTGMATTPPLHTSKLTPVSYPMAPESPIDKIASDVEALKLDQTNSLSPMPTCSSPLDVSKSLPRLPIFTRFANNGNNDSE